MPKSIFQLVVVSMLAGLSFLWPGQARAVDLSSGEVEASLDTTLSYGIAVRTEEPDDDLVKGLAAVNRNDGAANYKRGIISNAAKFTSDFDLGYQNLGLFLRATGFFDHENEEGSRARTRLSEQAKNMVGKDIDLLDAYVTGSFDAGETTVDIRLGKHVLNWGESTFIQSGINAINPFDVSKLRVPGAELREALVPVPLVSAVVDLPRNFSVEGFYQLDWKETVIDPVGTYFSVTDYVGPGATRAVLPISASISDLGHGFGPSRRPDCTPSTDTPPVLPSLTDFINCDLGGASLPAQPAFDPTFLNVPRGKDDEPQDSRQWGVALRFLAEELNNTEFGFYFMNYHSRLPTISAYYSPITALQGGLAAAGAVGDSSSAVTAAIQAAVELQVPQETQNRATVVAEQVAKQVSGVAQLLAIDRYAKAGNYQIEYADDIRLYGLSFNTQLGNSGWALQGEYSLRVDAPLQRKEENLIEEGLFPIIYTLTLSGCQTNATPTCQGILQQFRALTGDTSATYEDIRNAYLATYSPGRKVNGIIRANISQLQATATKAFGPALGADGWFFITEAALNRVHDMPDEAIESSALGEPADATSFGYRMAVRFDYNNAFESVNLSPYAQFRHDVSGNSPAPGRPFVKGLTGFTFGVRADYLSRWQGDLSYAMFGGSRNKLKDRDFITATIKYSF